MTASTPKKPKGRECQALIYDGTTGDDYYECKRPAKAWIKDGLKRSGWGGRQYLCGIHARAHDQIARRANRALSSRLITPTREAQQ